MKAGFGLFALVLLAALPVSAAPVLRPRPAQPAKRSVTTLPPNNLHLQDRALSIQNINEAQFNAIIDDVAQVFGPIVEGHGGKLVINKLWSNPTVNASADQSGNTWIVNMYGGLARRPEVTPDGFALVVCHELGHHLGGFAFYGEDWVSSDGQSDYWGAQVCLRKLWAGDRENRLARREVEPGARTQCDAAWANLNDRELCYRISEAGLSLATLFATMRSQAAPRFDTPDTTKVTTTFAGHPAPQCRLDTYLAGALCRNPGDPTKIPGRGHPAGQQSLGAETEAARYNCVQSRGNAFGARPACWFKSRL